MNHKLLQMLNEAGFEFTPDIMNKLPAFENLVWLEREAIAEMVSNCDSRATPKGIAAAIRARDKNAN